MCLEAIAAMTTAELLGAGALGLGAVNTVSTLTQGKPSSPAMPAAAKPPEAPKSPERDPFKRQNQQSANVAGPASTMLTGAGGVAPSGLSLGRNSLYDNASSKLGA